MAVFCLFFSIRRSFVRTGHQRWDHQSFEYADTKNAVKDDVGNLRTTACDEFQLIISQLDALGLGVEFRHGFEVR